MKPLKKLDPKIGAKPLAVLDTNILLSALLSPNGSRSKIIELLKKSLFILVTSQYLLDELNEVLDRPYFQKQYQLLPSKYSGIQEAIKTNCMIINKLSLPDIDIRDTKDLPVLATAIDGHANYLVTGDQDLLVLVNHKSIKSLKIVTPTEFIHIIDVKQISQLI